MNYRMIVRIMGRIMLVEAAFMTPALLIALFSGERESAVAFAVTMALLALLGVLAALLKTGRGGFFAREGFVTVGAGWIMVSLFGALPFFISGAVPSFIDCFFETVSGFTTTGASILTDVEALPKGLLYWRSFTHWLGGMGVLVFVLAIGPMSREAGYSMHLLRAESPGPVTGKLVPRMHRSAKILYEIYIALTVVQIIALLLTGMEPLESVATAFGTAGTGGFAIKNDSLASAPYSAQVIVTVFMALFGTNFNIFYLLILREFKKTLKNSELRAYILILVASVALITINIAPLFGSTRESWHHAAFQVSSIMTTTGFATVDFNLWPEFSRTLLVLLMVIGACAGSTGGGIKVVRALILVKSVKGTIEKVLHPNRVQVMHLGDEALEDETVSLVQSFMAVYIIFTAASALLVSLDGISFESGFTAVLACINNIGPGLGAVGPVSNYSALSALSKLVLCVDMLLGRLELFPIIILFTPSVWKK